MVMLSCCLVLGLDVVEGKLVEREDYRLRSLPVECARVERKVESAEK